MDSPSRNGILAGGLWLIDSTKTIDHYPEPSRLATIREVARSNGGGAFNVLVNLARLQGGVPLSGVGLTGDDADGAWIRDRARSHGIDTTQLHAVRGATTSFTDVMTEAANGRRTFFYFPGVNEQLAREHFEFRQSRARIFYLGYPGLLPRLDAPGPDGLSGVTRLLEDARREGLLTAVDLVSAESAHWPNFSQTLPTIDVLFANEWEAARVLGRPAPQEADVSPRLLTEMGAALLQRGAAQAVVVHASSWAVCLPCGAAPIVLGNVQVPASEIRGTCGAGDALAAGFLLGLHQGLGWRDCLELGLCAAATCLNDVTTSDGIRSWRDCLAYGRALGFRPL